MDITIRKMEKRDFEPLCSLLGNPAVMRYLEAPYTETQTRQFLERAGLQDTPLIYGVEQKGTFAGYVIYHPYDEKAMELGWVLFPEVWGQGLASALTERLIDKAFSHGKDLVIECVPEQTVSVHLAEKFGFRFFGLSEGLALYRLLFREAVYKNNS